MLYPTTNQPMVLLVIFCVSIISGLVFDLAHILTFLSGNDKNSKHIFDFLATIISFTLLFFTNLEFNYGQFRIYVLIIFLIFFAFERFLSKLLWTKVLSSCYNKLKLKFKGKSIKRKNGRKQKEKNN